MVYIFYCLFIILTSFCITKQEDATPQSVDPAVPEQVDMNSDPFTWQIIEEIAEFHPYIVALIDEKYIYRCTGSIINKYTVVTSAECISLNLTYIGLGLAIFDSENFVNNNSLKLINSATVHTALSKIGLVYSKSNDLTKYFGFVDIFLYQYYPVHPYRFEVVGYGTFPEKTGSALQKRTYNQSECPYPEMTIICGGEYFEGYKFEEETLGKGAPALSYGELYGVKGLKCGYFEHNMLNGSCDSFTKLFHIKQEETPRKPEEVLLRTVVHVKNASQKNAFVIQINLLLLFIVLMFQK